MMVKQQQYKNIFDLKDKVAIITGGYGHLGLSMSKALASFGAKVFVMGRKGPKKVDFDGNLTFIRCDVTNPTQVKKRIYDILENEHTKEEWDSGINNILSHSFFCTQSVIPQMLKQGSGSIINVSSIYGLLGHD